MRESLRDRLRNIVTSATAPRRTYARGSRQGRVLAIAAHKGGVGKTTTAVSLAAALVRRHGWRVLVIDLDPQGHASASLGSMLRGSGVPLGEVLESDPPREVLDAVIHTTLDRLDLTGWDPRLIEVEEVLGRRDDGDSVLRASLEATRTHYDLIVIDAPPSLGPLTRNALAAADAVLVPCDLNPLSIRGVDSILHAVVRARDKGGVRAHLLGVLLTRVDVRNRSLNESVESALRTHHGGSVLATKIPVSTAFAHAQLEGVDIFDHEPNGRAALAYALLADEVVAELG